MWPSDADSLIAYQQQLAAAVPEPYTVDPSTANIGGMLGVLSTWARRSRY